MIVVTRERNSEAWRAAHVGRVTASDCRALFARRSSKTYRQLVERVARDLDNGHGTERIEHPDPWHLMHEQLLVAALAAYRATTPRRVQTLGFVCHNGFSWLGASPHALVASEALTSLRCVWLRPHFSLRSYHERGITRADEARAQLTMYVCGRLATACEVVDYWDGGGRVPDLMRCEPIEYDRAFVDEQLTPRLLDLWRDVQGALATLQCYGSLGR